jgi:hypothetical protein
MPPVAVKTVPQSGDTAVGLATREIRVQFSKKMHDGTRSWSQLSAPHVRCKVMANQISRPSSGSTPTRTAKTARPDN